MQSPGCGLSAPKLASLVPTVASVPPTEQPDQHHEPAKLGGGQFRKGYEGGKGGQCFGEVFPHAHIRRAFAQEKWDAALNGRYISLCSRPRHGAHLIALGIRDVSLIWQPSLKDLAFVRGH